MQSILRVFLFLALTVSAAAQTAPSSAPQAPASRGVFTQEEEKEIEEMQAEAAEHDVAYVKSRLVFRYDWKSQAGETLANRGRLKAQYAFGPKKRLAIYAVVPILGKDKPTDSAVGLGDIELAFGGNLYKGERFKMGALVELTVPSASDDFLGSGNTKIKPAWGFTVILHPRVELNTQFNYKRSLYITRGTPTNEFEPDITLNLRAKHVTWWTEYDSYYLFETDQYAQTQKFGFSKSFTRGDSKWIVAPYYSFPMSAAGRSTQYIHQVGIDVTWFPKK
jgi:hypothetical protein